MVADHLNRMKYEHTLVCQEASGPIRQRLEANGWEIIELGVPKFNWDLRWLFRARSAVKGLKPDVIHGAVSEGNLLAIFLAGAFPQVKIVTEETSDGVGRRLLGRWLAKIIYRRSDAVVAVSPAVQAYLVEDLGIREQKVHLVVNGVETPRNFSPASISHFRKELGIAPEAIIVGSVGRLHDLHKGFSQLLGAMTRLVNEFPNLVLVIFGNGPDRENLEALSEELGLKRHVIFAGYREKTHPIFQIMDIFALASSMEAFGLVVAEAMLARVPVVASSVGGIPDILQFGECGLLVADRFPEEFARAISLLLNRPDLADELRERASKRATKSYTAENYVSSVQGLWSSLVG